MTHSSHGVLVLGMHRSGTSLVTGLVSALGFDAAGRLMPANAINPRGFWEHVEVARVHDEFLGRWNRRWSHTGPLPAAAFSGREAELARREIRRILETDFLQRERWVVKDPRLCRLLPLWAPLLDRGELTVRFLMVLRSPEEIAASLRRRDGFDREQSLMLWLRHMLEAERATRGRPRYWLDLERFVGDPPAALAGLADWLGADDRRSSDEEILAATYDASLLRHGAATETTPSPPGAADLTWIEEARAALGSLQQGPVEPPEVHRSLDRIASELGRLDHAILTGSACRFLVDERDEAVRQRDDLAQRNAQLERTLERVLTSRSWRLTRPLRSWMGRLRGLRRGTSAPDQE